MDARIVAYRVRSLEIIDQKADPNPFTRASVGFVVPRSVAARIVSQNGLFSAHHEPDKAWAEPLADQDHVFDISAGMRDYFQQRLFHLGIDAQRIMTGLDGLGARLAWQYRVDIGFEAVR